MSEYVGIISSLMNDNTSSIATEGKVGDFFGRIGNKIKDAVARVIEFLNKAIANITAAFGRIPSQASKADSRIRPVVTLVDKMVAVSIKTFNDVNNAIKDNAKVDNSNSRSDWTEIMNTNYSNLENLKSQVDGHLKSISNLAGTDRRLSKAGANAAKVGMNSWLGKLNLIHKQAEQLSNAYANDSTIKPEETHAGKVAKCVSLTMSTITEAAQAMMTGCKKVADATGDPLEGEVIGSKNEGESEKDLSSEGQKALSGENQKGLGNGESGSLATRDSEGIATNSKNEGQTSGTKERSKTQQKKLNHSKGNTSKKKQKNLKKMAQQKIQNALKARKKAENDEKILAGVDLSSLLPELDSADLEYVVEAMIAMIDYSVYGEYHPETDVGHAIESQLELECTLEDLDMVCVGISADID